MIVSGSNRHFRYFVLALSLLLVGGAVIRITACGDRTDVPSQPVAQVTTDDPAQAQAELGSTEGLPGTPATAAEEQPAPGSDEPENPAPAPAAGPIQVIVYYPAANSNGLIGEPREIFRTAAPSDRAKQIVADLISGPVSKQALRAIPGGSRLRQIYVLDSVAWVDFSIDLKAGMVGGSREEILTVYSIVDSIALNISEIRRVGILINGQPIETLSGHVDLRRPLKPMRSLIVGTVSAGPAPADSPSWADGGRKNGVAVAGAGTDPAAGIRRTSS